MKEIRDVDTWNRTIHAFSETSFLQSYEWGELQQKLGRGILRVVSNDAGIAALCIRHPLPLGARYWYVPHGPLFKKGVNQEDELEEFAHFISRQQSNTRSIMLRIDPPPQNDSKVLVNTITRTGFVKAPNDMQPIHTIHIDLTKEEGMLLDDMKHNTRYAVRAAERRGVTVQQFHSQEEKRKAFFHFWALFEKTHTRHNIKRYQKEYYEYVTGLFGHCYTDIFLAYTDDGALISGAIIVHFGNTAYYMYAASDPKFSKLNAPSRVLWEAMVNAKHIGRKIFDLWGISDIKKTWRGLTKFKRGFGGEEVHAPGTWDLPIRKLWYTGYKSVKKLLDT